MYTHAVSLLEKEKKRLTDAINFAQKEFLLTNLSAYRRDLISDRRKLGQIDRALSKLTYII